VSSCARCLCVLTARGKKGTRARANTGHQLSFRAATVATKMHPAGIGIAFFNLPPPPMIAPWSLTCLLQGVQHGFRFGVVRPLGARQAAYPPSASPPAAAAVSAGAPAALAML
jgi:hypothetical protein